MYKDDASFLLKLNWFTAKVTVTGKGKGKGKGRGKTDKKGKR